MVVTTAQLRQSQEKSRARQERAAERQRLLADMSARRARLQRDAEEATGPKVAGPEPHWNTPASTMQTRWVARAVQHEAQQNRNQVGADFLEWARDNEEKRGQYQTARVEAQQAKEAWYAQLTSPEVARGELSTKRSVRLRRAEQAQKRAFGLLRELTAPEMVEERKRMVDDARMAGEVATVAGQNVFDMFTGAVPPDAMQSLDRWFEVNRDSNSRFVSLIDEAEKLGIISGLPDHDALDEMETNATAALREVTLESAMTALNQLPDDLLPPVTGVPEKPQPRITVASAIPETPTDYSVDLLNRRSEQQPAPLPSTMPSAQTPAAAGLPSAPLPSTVPSAQPSQEPPAQAQVPAAEAEGGWTGSNEQFEGVLRKIGASEGWGADFNGRIIRGERVKRGVYKDAGGRWAVGYGENYPNRRAALQRADEIERQEAAGMSREQITMQSPLFQRHFAPVQQALDRSAITTDRQAAGLAGISWNAGPGWGLKVLDDMLTGKDIWSIIINTMVGSTNAAGTGYDNLELYERRASELAEIFGVSRQQIEQTIPEEEAARKRSAGDYEGHTKRKTV